MSDVESMFARIVSRIADTVPRDRVDQYESVLKDIAKQTRDSHYLSAETIFIVHNLVGFPLPTPEEA